MVRRPIAWIVAALALSACVSVTPSPSIESAPASASASAWPSGPDLPLVEPDPGELAAGSGAQVDAIGLAVRRGPGLAYPLVAGYQLDPISGQEVLVADEVRLDSGYFTYVSQGPLQIGGISWYQILAIPQPDDASEDVWRWDADGDGSNFDPGWVAGSVPEDTYLIPAEVPCPSGDPSCGNVIPPYAVLHSSSSGRSVTFQLGIGLGVEWAAADPQGQSCDIKITLRPNGIVLVDTTVARFGGGDVTWPFDLEQDVEGEYWLDIESDCTWSLTAPPIIG